jgi:N-acetylglucosaminyl-diphospho-decaprenol L-rhamnosyltransferase
VHIRQRNRTLDALGIRAVVQHGAAMDVTVISVAYNSMSVLPGMVESLHAGLPLVIVDNGPDDGLRAWAKSRGIDCRVPGENLGFGRACNLGAAGAATPFLLFLNPDARLQAGTLDALLAAAARHPGAAAFGAALQDGAGHVGYKHRTRLAPQDRFAPKVVPTADTAVPALSGAALMVRRAAFAAVGGFDPAIFLYYEDDDLSLRLRASQGPLIFVPSAVATHYSGKSSTPSTALSHFKGYHWARSRIYTARKHGLAWPWLAGLRNALWQIVGPKGWRSAERRAEGRGRMAGVWSMRRAERPSP